MVCSRRWLCMCVCVCVWIYMNLLSIFPYLLLQSRILHMLSETFVSHRMIFFLYAHVVLILFFTEAQFFFCIVVLWFIAPFPRGGHIGCFQILLWLTVVWWVTWYVLLQVDRSISSVNSRHWLYSEPHPFMTLIVPVCPAQGKAGFCQQFVSLPVYLQLLQHSMLSDFGIFANFTGEKEKCVWVYFISEVTYLSNGSATCIFFTLNCRSFAHAFFALLVFF